MKKVTLQKFIITHVPTSTVWDTDFEEVDDSDQAGMREICRNVVTSKVAYLQVKVNRKDVYIPQSILDNCVMEIESETKTRH